MTSRFKAIGAGVKIQRPLAIVVIGGTFTKTLRTLPVLRALYSRFRDKQTADVER